MEFASIRPILCFSIALLLLGGSVSSPISFWISYNQSAYAIPLAPLITTASSTTSNTTPTIDGTAELGATVEIFEVTVVADLPVLTSLGTATADLVVPTIWSFTTPILSGGPHTIIATATDVTGPSPSSNSITITVVTTGTVVGTVYNDANGNGVQELELGEIGVQGITVNIHINSPIEDRTTTTDATGLYGFDNVPIGLHTVTLDLNSLPGQIITITDPPLGYHTEELLEGMTHTHIFGVTISPVVIPVGTVVGTVYGDTNGNGVQELELGEIGVQGITVNIHINSPIEDRTTTTDATGLYGFDNVPIGLHTVTLDLNSLPGQIITITDPPLGYHTEELLEGMTHTHIFGVTISQGDGGSNNSSPVANDDSATTDFNTPVTVHVVSNDSDPDGDTLFISSVTQGTNGMVTTSIGFLSQIGTFGDCDGLFCYPHGVAVDSSGNVYVADTYNHRILKFDSAGQFSSQIGTGQLYSPHGVAVDSFGNVYVADTYNHRILKFDSAGQFSSQIGTNIPGYGSLYSPHGVAVDSFGNVYVTDTYNHRILKFDSAGLFLSQIGTGLYYPFGVAVDSSGNVYVTDTYNHLIQKFDSAGLFLSQFGTPGSGNGQLLYPTGVAVDSSGNVYVADQSNHRIQKFDSNGIFLSQFGTPGFGDGQLLYPFGVAVDSSGNVYVADTYNHRVQIFGTVVTDLTYTPNPDFAGDDTFTYTISDGRGGDASANVIVHVNPSPFGTVVGTLYDDTNGNGHQDADEFGISDIQINIRTDSDEDDDDDDDDFDEYTYTDENGFYEFEDVPAGFHQVFLYLDDLEGYIITEPPLGYHTAELTAGDTHTHNFGVTIGQVGTVVGRLYDDTNGNGHQDEDEFGISDIQINIHIYSTNEDDYTYTDENGFYEFEDVPTGLHYVSPDLSDELPEYFITEPSSGYHLAELTADDTHTHNFGVTINQGEGGPQRSGGPDYFGYRFIGSNTQGGPVFDWIDVTDGTQILPDSDDRFVEGVPIGFSFKFYGRDYNNLAVTNNGLTLVRGGTYQYYNEPIGQSSPSGFITPFWDDLVTYRSDTDAVYYKTIGDAPNRKFVVEWFDTQHYSSSPSGITFEVILYEGSNDIRFQYQDVNFGYIYYNFGASATVGIESPLGIGLQYSYNEAALSDNLAILFTAGQATGDTTKPIITLLGDNPVIIEVGSTYNDAGATALDDVDADISAYIVPTSTVDTSVVGTYTVTYDVTDAAGNHAIPVVRTVNVVSLVSSIPPSVTLGITVPGEGTAVVTPVTAESPRSAGTLISFLGGIIDITLTSGSCELGCPIYFTFTDDDLVNAGISDVSSVTVFEDHSGTGAGFVPLETTILDGAPSPYTVTATTFSNSLFGIGVLVDDIKPAITILSPTNLQTVNTTSVDISGTSSDAFGIQRVEVKVDSGPATQVTLLDGAWSFTTPALSNGLHIITAKATDNSGFTSTASIIIIVNVVGTGGPAITALVADGSNGGEGTEFSNGDTIAIIFSESTNQPPVATKDDLNNLFTFSQNLGTDYTGTFVNPSTLVITIVDATGATPPTIGDLTVTVRSDVVQLRNSAGTSDPSISTSPPLSGSFGVFSVSIDVGQDSPATVILPTGVITQVTLLNSSGTVTIETTNATTTFTGTDPLSFIGNVIDVVPTNGASCVDGCLISFTFTDDDLFTTGLGLDQVRIFHDKNSDDDFADEGEAFAPDPPLSFPGPYTVSVTESSNSKFAIGGVKVLAIAGLGGGAGGAGPSISQFSVTTENQAGFAAILELDPNKPHTNVVDTFDPSTVTMRLSHPEGASSVKHVAIYLNLGGIFRDVANSDTYIVWDKNKELQVVDPQGFMKDVGLKVTTVGKSLQLKLSLTFVKEMPKSDVLVRTWDADMNSRNIRYKDAVQIVPPQTISPESKVPLFVKNNAKFWADGQITDGDFVKGIQYLIQNKIMIVPTPSVTGTTTPSVTGITSPIISGTTTAPGIPAWVKNNAKWWSEDQITEKDFLSGIQWMIANGVITVGK